MATKRRCRRPIQLELPAPRTWGGRRRGAGPKRAPGRPRMPHKTRPPHLARHPEHVTLRARCGLPSLRGDRAYSFLLTAISRASKDHFRIIQFSVQVDHIHLLVEADDRTALIRGVQGWPSVARAPSTVPSTVAGQSGPTATTAAPPPPRARCALATSICFKIVSSTHEILRESIRKSSGPWFEGWQQAPPRPDSPSPVRKAKTWLATVGWRLAGPLIGWTETPARAPSPPPR